LSVNALKKSRAMMMLMMNEEDWIQETDGYLPILN
jgi:hypothetical protein